MDEIVGSAVPGRAERDAALDALRHELSIGIDALERGEWVEGEEAFERLLRPIAAAPEACK